MKTSFPKAVRAAVALGIALVLAGCVVYPGGPGYGYHPYRWGWYR